LVSVKLVFGKNQFLSFGFILNVLKKVILAFGWFCVGRVIPRVQDVRIKSLFVNFG